MHEKPANLSSVVMPVRMMPQDANPAGFVHGGIILKHIDLAGAMVAMRHCRSAVVTVSIDRMDFLAVCNVGEAVTFTSSVNFAGRTSMEVGVRVEAEDLLTGSVRHAGSAYLTYVAVDSQGRPTPVPALRLESPAERRRFAEARLRREARLSERAFERSSQAAPGPEDAPSPTVGSDAPASPAGTRTASELDGPDASDAPDGPGRTVAESGVVMPVRMMPQDANPAGNVHGGVILKHIDLAGAMAAMRHCRSQVVTASIDRMEFLGAAHVGEMMTFKALVNRAGGCTMEAGIRVETEDLLTGAVRHVGSAYLTFTALDARREPVAVPRLLLSSALELRRNAEALRRQDTRSVERGRERANQGQGFACPREAPHAS